MKLIERENIDTQKWDEAVSKAEIENIFLYSWYLDAVCTQWAGLITEDYKTILPVPYTKKMGIKQMIQAPFTREYEILGNEFDWEQALVFLADKFKGIHFRCPVPGILKSERKRTHQFLLMGHDLKKNYSTNAKRILKKQSNYTLYAEKDPVLLLNLFREHVAHKVDTISKQDLIVLEQLMRDALSLNHGEMLVVKEDRDVVAAGFFLFDKQRVTYLKGASTETAKKSGAMYYLIDQALQRYEGYKTFDFGGSDIETVAEFYHKFGASDRVYYDYTIDDLPFWFKTLKKLKR